MADTNPVAAFDAIKEAFESLGGAQTSLAVVRWIGERYPGKWEDRVLRARLRGGSVNHTKAISYHPNWLRFLYFRGRGEFELYDKERHGFFDERGYPEGQNAENSGLIEEAIETADGFEGTGEFAYEAHLRDYLAKNLGLLEAGLTLWTGSAVDSIEYPIEGRRIDILAKDREGIPVVVELKLRRGHEQTLGQALYYRGKLKQLLSETRVRIIMVASEITDELRIASAEVTDVDLFSYTLTMQVEKIALNSASKFIWEPGDVEVHDAG